MSENLYEPAIVAQSPAQPALVPLAGGDMLLGVTTVDPVAAERARAAAIQQGVKPGFQALAALAVAEGWTIETFLSAQSASETAVTAATQAAQVAAFRDGLPRPVASGGGGQEIDAMTPEQRAEAKWSEDAGIRAEFGQDKGSYLAFVKAEASGKVRMLRRS